MLLQDIASLLQAPKRALWSALPGLHDQQTGEAYSGSQVASNLLGTDPDSLWSKALGFGLDVAGDPLTLAAPFAGRAAGAMSKALGAGSGLTPEAINGATSLKQLLADSGIATAETASKASPYADRAISFTGGLGNPGVASDPLMRTFLHGPLPTGAELDARLNDIIAQLEAMPATNRVRNIPIIGE